MVGYYGLFRRESLRPDKRSVAQERYLWKYSKKCIYRHWGSMIMRGTRITYWIVSVKDFS